jgi:bacterioferritin
METPAKAFRTAETPRGLAHVLEKSIAKWHAAQASIEEGAVIPEPDLSTSRESGQDKLDGMRGSPNVIAALNEALKEELTAINQYFLHSEMCENWHYKKLADHIKKESIDEMRHAEALIERILFLDGLPNMTELMQLSVGSNVKAQLESDLDLEIRAVAMYNRFVQLARDEGDNASRELFERLLKDEERHVDWLEAQVHQMKEMGYERYLSQQIREEE